VPNPPRVLVLAEPDPDVALPPLHLIPGDVEVVTVDSTPTDEELATASPIWPHCCAEPTSCGGSTPRQSGSIG